jgi:hypothetical protein
MIFLTLGFLLHCSPEFGVDGGDIVGTAKHVMPPARTVKK